MMNLIKKITFTPDSLEDIVEKARDWALLHGLSMREKSADHLTFLPFTLFPSSFPRIKFDEVHSAQRIINKLMHRVAYDSKFLLETLEQVIEVDDFTCQLVKIYKQIENEPNQPLSLGLLRSDYMLNLKNQKFELDVKRKKLERLLPEDEIEIKQVEVNTIASGHGWVGTVCPRLHRYILEEVKMSYTESNSPSNYPLNGLCEAMKLAWQEYKNPSAVVLMVIEDVNYNIADQRYHEYRLQELEPRIRVFRRTLTEIYHSSKLEGSENRLFIDNEEIALIYFRSGYSPQQYKGEAEWEARLRMEKSKAIKCPTVGLQLAGTKKVQQVLTKPGCLERFLDPEDCNEVRKLFTGHYSLNFTEEGETAIERALSNPENFVLKPQREGGANNFFGADLKTKLESMRNEKERCAWILMDKIKAPIGENCLVRPGNRFELIDTTSELGIFGAILGDKTTTYSNVSCGFSMRSKIATSNETGLSSGCGACDSPFFY